MEEEDVILKSRFLKTMELRKQKEIEYANRLKSLLEGVSDREKIASNEKFYAITRESRNYLNKWLLERISGDKTFLDYCCGDGGLVLFLAEKGAKATGIDISDVSIEIARKKAKAKSLEDRVEFLVMDGENLKFKDNSFDFIVCNGVLHHLDIEKAYSELSRVIKPGGEIICVEPLIYNPIFHLYRKFTPHLRTEWETEHILRKKDIFLAKKYFDKIEFRFFHLISLAAVPFRNTPIFNFILRPLEISDSVLLKLPFLKWWAWQVMFIFSARIPRPRRGGDEWQPVAERRAKRGAERREIHKSSNFANFFAKRKNMIFAKLLIPPPIEAGAGPPLRPSFVAEATSVAYAS